MSVATPGSGITTGIYEMPAVNKQRVGMKLLDMHERVQAVAAEALAETLRERVDLLADNRTETAKQVAVSVREAFETLFNA